MFTVNGNPILQSEVSVLRELKQQLLEQGIDRFTHIKVGTTNIQFTCPMHNEGHEHKPSCGITIVAKGSIPTGMVHCFTCGYTAMLEEMVSNCFGYDDTGVFGRDWLVKNFLTLSVEDRKDLIVDCSRVPAVVQPEYVPEEVLDSYRYIHDYMYKRKLTDKVIEQFDIGYDCNFKLMDHWGKVNKALRCITFPVRDITGGTLFVARRSVDIKFFHYPAGVNKPVYGLYELPKDANEIIVCESMFNALTCYVYGRPAVALLGLGTEYQYEQLRKLPCRKFITALDPDTAGRNATERLRKALAKTKIVTRYELPEGKDVNDLTEEEFNDLKEMM